MDYIHGERGCSAFFLKKKEKKEKRKKKRERRKEKEGRNTD